MANPTAYRLSRLRRSISHHAASIAPMLDAVASRHGLTPRTAARARTAGRSGSWVLGGATGALIGLFSLMDYLFRPVSTPTGLSFDQMREASPALAAALGAVTLAIGGPMVLGALQFGVDFRRSRFLFIVALVVCLSIPMSLLSVPDAKAFLYIPLVFGVFAYLVVGTAANMDPEDFLRGLGLGVVLVQTAMFLVVIAEHDQQWGRLYGHNSANYWGMAAQCAVMGCFVVRNLALRLFAVGVSVVILLWTQSRGSIVSLGVAVPFGFFLYAVTTRQRFWTTLVIAAGLVMAITFGGQFIADRILLLSDPGRGLASGFTGRASAWRETLDLFAAHPWFGVGYRQHEQYVTSALSAHNAYLASLADTGILGTLAYVMLLFGGMTVAVVKILRNPSAGRIMAASFLVAYAFNGIFERAALNTGNSYSMMMLVLCAWSWREDSETRRYWPVLRQRWTRTGRK